MVDQVKHIEFCDNIPCSVFLLIQNELSILCIQNTMHGIYAAKLACVL